MKTIVKNKQIQEMLVFEKKYEMDTMTQEELSKVYSVLEFINKKYPSILAYQERTSKRR